MKARIFEGARWCYDTAAGQDIFGSLENPVARPPVPEKMDGALVKVFANTAALQPNGKGVVRATDREGVIGGGTGTMWGMTMTTMAAGVEMRRRYVAGQWRSWSRRRMRASSWGCGGAPSPARPHFASSCRGRGEGTRLTPCGGCGSNRGVAEPGLGHPSVGSVGTLGDKGVEPSAVCVHPLPL